MSERKITTLTNPESIGYMEDSRDAEQAARSKFIEMDAMKYKDGTPKYPGIRLVMSNHWASEGWWVEWGETAKKKLPSEDSDISELARTNPELLTAK